MAAAEERNAKYAAEAAANKAEQERMDRASERTEERKQQRRRRAKQEAMYAKSGVLLDGTPSNYLTAQAETDELNVQRADQVSKQHQINALYQGNLQKADHLAKSNSYEFAASSSKAAAKNTLIGGAFNTVSAGAGAYSGAGGSFSWANSAPVGSAATSSSSMLGSSALKSASRSAATSLTSGR